MNVYKLNMTEFFAEVLRAPLANHRQSWGAVTADEDIVYLRAWTDQVERIEGRECVKVLSDNWRSGPFGYQERQRHLQLIAQGAACFVVMCEPVSPLDGTSRTVKRCLKDGLYRGGQVIDHEGCLWMARAGFVRTSEHLDTLPQPKLAG